MVYRISFPIGMIQEQNIQIQIRYIELLEEVIWCDQHDQDQKLKTPRAPNMIQHWFKI